ncbi:MAG: hypothetical protein QME62_01020 [Armatimonadota bacterium]|nr:hypothetical protein [Armatimonadota bacterium]
MIITKKKGSLSGTKRGFSILLGRVCPIKIRWQIIGKTFLILTSFILAPQSQAKTTPKLIEPDVLIFIQLTGTNMDFVSFTYPKVVPQNQAMAHLSRVSLETGWQTLDLRITNNSLLKSGSNPMTSVEFTTPQAVRLDLGGFPIEPLIKAFKDLKHIEIVYVTPQNFAFQGLKNFENKYVKITLQRGTNTYRYQITIKDSGFETLGLPFLQPEVPNTPKTEVATEHKSRTMAVVLIIIIALIAGVLTYYFIRRLAAINYSGRQRR